MQYSRIIALCLIGLCSVVPALQARATEAPQVQGMYFDGDGDCAVIDGKGLLDFGTNDFTIDLWMYPLKAGSDESQALITQRDPSVKTKMGLFLRDGKLLFWGGVNDTWSPIESQPLTWEQRYYHVAVVRCKGTVRIYRDGDVVAEGPFTHEYRSRGSFVIGAWDPVVPRQEFCGYVNYARVIQGRALWNGVFTPPVAPDDYAADDPDRVLFFDFDAMENKEE